MGGLRVEASRGLLCDEATQMQGAVGNQSIIRRVFAAAALNAFPSRVPIFSLSRRYERAGFRGTRHNSERN